MGGKEEVGGVKNSRKKKEVSGIGSVADRKREKSVVRFLEFGKKRETRRRSEFVAAAALFFLGGFLEKKGGEGQVEEMAGILGVHSHRFQRTQ